MSIALLEAKCKSIGAIYQLRPKPIRQLPGASSHSIRFSGSPNPELNHIFEVTEAPGRALVMVFSSTLRFDDDYDVLASGVNQINRRSSLGTWIYEEKPGLKQFCFLVTVELGFSGSSSMKTEVLWQTIVYIDSSYKEQVNQLAEYQLVTHKINPSASLSGFPSSFVNSLISQLEGVYGKTTCSPENKHLHFSFTGRFTSERLVEKCKTFLADLKIGSDVYEAQLYFCDQEKPAVFTPLHRTTALLHRLSRFNAALGVGCFVYLSDRNVVAFRYKCYWRDYHLAQLPSSLKSLYITLATKLPAYFEYIQKYYLHPNQAEATVASPIVPHHDEYDLFEQQYNSATFIKELAELSQLERTLASKHLLREAYEVRSPSSSIVRKVPYTLVPLSALWDKDLIPSREEISLLLEVMQDLRESRAFYSNLRDMVYFMREESYPKVVLIPFALYAHRTDCSAVNVLMTNISSKLLEYVGEWIKPVTLKSAVSELQPPSIIDFAYISSPSPGLFRLGATDVDLTMVLNDRKSYGELHSIMHQVQLFRKKATAYHLLVYGLTLKEGKLYLVTEAAGKYPSLSTWVTTKSGRNDHNKAELIRGIIAAVRTLHRAGTFQLFLSSEDIRVRELPNSCRPIPVLTANSLPAALHYPASHQDNWLTADVRSCVLLCYHLHLGRFPEYFERGAVLRQPERAREGPGKRVLAESEELEQAWSWLSRFDDISDFLTQRN